MIQRRGLVACVVSARYQFLVLRRYGLMTGRTPKREGMLSAVERMMQAMQSKPDQPSSPLEFARGLRQFIVMMDEAEGEASPGKAS